MPLLSPAEAYAESRSENDWAHKPMPQVTRAWRFFETVLIFGLFFLVAGTVPPGVNESHYLVKAKHYWDPQWCAGDLFLESADAHETFYWTFGWLTLFASLDVTAWIGRLLTWGLLAWRWQLLSETILPKKLYSVLSAALWMTLVRWGHVAGEWVVGGVEAKGFAYIFVLWSLHSLVRGCWNRSILLGGLAAAFHVIVGGWTLIGIAFTWLLSRQPNYSARRMQILSFLGAVILAMPGVIPGLSLNSSVPAETVNAANQIYVFERLSHHLVFDRFPPHFVARHVFLIALFFLIWRWLVGYARQSPLLRDLPRFVTAGILLALMGAFLDQVLKQSPNLSATLLRYYWFRLSDVMTPLGVTFGLLTVLLAVQARHPKLARGGLAAVFLISAAGVVIEGVERRRDPRPPAFAQAYPAGHQSAAEKMYRYGEWLKMCDWVRQHTKPSDRFLTPRNQQTFKWDAHRPEVVNGKDIPQDATAIVEWRRRMAEIFPPHLRFHPFSAHGEHRLIELSQKYKFRYIVLHRGITGRRLQLTRVYPQGTAGFYEVYELPPGREP